MECFDDDHQLDQCSYCLPDGLYLKGEPRRLNDFLCLCPKYYSAEQCQFSTQPFSFTLDQLFSDSSYPSRTISSRSSFFVILCVFTTVLDIIFSLLVSSVSLSFPLIDKLFCQLLGYLLTCLIRLSSWLPSFVALEHVYTIYFINHFIPASHFLMPLLINRCSMLAIMSIVIKNKMRIRGDSQASTNVKLGIEDLALKY